MFNISFIGDENTGRRTLLKSFANFKEDFFSKIGPDFINHTLMLQKSKIKLRLWLQGIKKNPKLIRDFSYFKFSNAITFLFDKSRRETFENIEYWVEKIIRYIKANTVLILIGNKIDLLAEVSFDEAQEKAEKFNMTYFEISATDKELVSISFEITTRLLIHTQQN